MTSRSTGVSVIMPSYNQGRFISRAITSLKEQTHENWELLIINDGSTDDTSMVVRKFLCDSRIKYIEHQENKGLGACLNIGMAAAVYDLIAYLPSDDIYYKDHLQDLSLCLQENPAALMSFSGVRHHYNRQAQGIIEGYTLQLVQVMHRKTNDRWIERSELVTDDLNRMFWSKLEVHAQAIGTGRVTCEWVDHPHQRHKIIQEPIGGINPYRLYYGVKKPLRFHSTVGNLIDEIAYYKPFQEKLNYPSTIGSLKILLVGELAYNPERVLALEEQGHKLYGLWMKDPYWYNYVGPFPFGNIETISADNWEERVAEINPDVIYALLNWQTVPFAHEVLTKNPGIPFVWHFKEGPFICLEKGTWNQLIDLYTKSDGQIYTSAEMRDWFHQFIPEVVNNSLVLDGDLPKKNWFTNERTPLLSEKDGEIHTVVPGRPIGLHPHTVEELGKHKIHVHFYGDFTHGQWKEWIKKTMTIAPKYLHIHSNCTQDNWVKEFSQYDAGWLHFFKSENNGELMRANWDDLNYPARVATLAAAGLPMLQRDNTGHIVATQSLVKEHGIGIFFNSIEQLANQLSDREQMQRIRKQVWQKRMMFTFDEHVHKLVNFFQQIIDYRKHAIRRTGIFSLEMELGDSTPAAHHEQAVG
ncbi:glycosyltransferase family 2 protein [Chryseosolibacter indicus]|uniref:Glycosyltransferase family 2 protein n=1 Tax=Chryseosolibacter indicus TaxID=2782351 RepID=A0ABS5VN18_9BACT|nr:glycosyltransferase family A protein [Chryseosolibacter indicus]MBT1702842.1 glycosyltransferase family 2 protein [Chryseosolibacter indicus]